MEKRYSFLANWKMNFSFNQTVEFATDSYNKLLKLSEESGNEIIIFPSTESIYALSKIFKSTHIKIGSQNCSQNMAGSFTGQVSPKSLKELGCYACIIGHSEQRAYLGETESIINKKFEILTSLGIKPVLCIGETWNEHTENKTENKLYNQILSIIDTKNSNKSNNKKFYLAYEPIWSIGTGKTPDAEDLEKIFIYIEEILKKHELSKNCKLLYGGSVSEENIAFFKKIQLIDGFLLGKASLDFQKLENIVK